MVEDLIQRQKYFAQFFKRLSNGLKSFESKPQNSQLELKFKDRIKNFRFVGNSYEINLFDFKFQMMPSFVEFPFLTIFHLYFLPDGNKASIELLKIQIHDLGGYNFVLSESEEILISQLQQFQYLKHSIFDPEEQFLILFSSIFLITKAKKINLWPAQIEDVTQPKIN